VSSKVLDYWIGHCLPLQPLRLWGKSTRSIKIYGIWPQASKHSNKHTHMHNAVTLVWGCIARCVCMYVCMYVCTYVCMYVRMYAFMYDVCMYVCMYVGLLVAIYRKFSLNERIVQFKFAHESSLTNKRQRFSLQLHCEV